MKAGAWSGYCRVKYGDLVRDGIRDSWKYTREGNWDDIAVV